jgi:hypothetical protein
MFKSLPRLINLNIINYKNSQKYSIQALQNNNNNKTKEQVVVKPLEHEDFFDVKKLVDLNQLFQ